MKRCFVALTIPETTRRALATLQAGLRTLPRGAARKIRPVKPDNLHVTLTFLGDTPDAQIPEVVETLRLALARATRPRALLEGVGAFPNPQRPRAVFAAFGSGRKSVAQLGARVEDALAPLGFEPERRARVPHVTLARIDGAKRGGAMTRWIEGIEPVVYGPIVDETVVLFESHLTGRGSIYTPLATLELAAS